MSDEICIVAVKFVGGKLISNPDQHTLNSLRYPPPPPPPPPPLPPSPPPPTHPDEVKGEYIEYDTMDINMIKHEDEYPRPGTSQALPHGPDERRETNRGKRVRFPDLEALKQLQPGEDDVRDRPGRPVLQLGHKSYYRTAHPDILVATEQVGPPTDMSKLTLIRNNITYLTFGRRNKRCHLCNKSMTSQSNLVDHLRGRLHSRNVYRDSIHFKKSF